MVFFHFVLLLVAPTIGFACTIDSDCSLNGICVESECVCDPVWKGESCHRLNEGLSNVAVHLKDAWSWGGSPILGPDDKWHVFVSVIMDGCGLLHYQTNSVIYHAESIDVLGPYNITGEALAPGRPGQWDSGAVHGGSVHFDASSRKYLLFHTGFQYDLPSPNCTQNGSIAPIMNSSSRKIGLAWSWTLKGPWQKLPSPILGPRQGAYWDNTDVSNAAPFVFPNGSVLLGYRAGGDGVALGGGIGISFAAHWSKKYNRISGHDHVLFAAEDAYLYQDHRGSFHMLVHAFRNGSVGGHAWSSDGLSWNYSKFAPAYTNVVHWQNGSASSLYRRERPQPAILNKKIVALFTGAWPCHLVPDPNTDIYDGFGCASFTMVTPILGMTNYE